MFKTSSKSLKTKIAAVALAAVTLTAGVAGTSQQAQAGHKGAAIGLGIATGVLIGAAAANSYYGPTYVGYGHRHCRWVRQYDEFGYYVGRTRVCGY